MELKSVLFIPILCMCMYVCVHIAYITNIIFIGLVYYYFYKDITGNTQIFYDFYFIKINNFISIICSKIFLQFCQFLLHVFWGSTVSHVCIFIIVISSWFIESFIIIKYLFYF